MGREIFDLQFRKDEGVSSKYSMRPARDSEDWRIKSRDAEPKIKNRAGWSLRSRSTRSSGNNSGVRWISSMTTAAQRL